MTRPSARARRADDSGFTLIEVLTVMVVAGILMAIALPSWRNYSANQAVQSATRDVVAVLRNAQVRSVAEETTYRVDFNTTTSVLTTYRFDGTGYALSKTANLAARDVQILNPVFTGKTGTSASAYFYARGTASEGSVQVQRPGRAPHSIQVEGLTGRVSYK